MAFGREGSQCNALKEPKLEPAQAPCSERSGEAARLTLSPTPHARRQSGSFLSTGWFTMILALELCEEIVVYGMVSDGYCRSGQPDPGRGDLGGCREGCGPHARGSGTCRAYNLLASQWAVEAQMSLELVPRGKGLSLWDRLGANLRSASVALGQSHSLPEPSFPYCEGEKTIAPSSEG